MRPTRQNSTVSLTSVLPSTEASKFPSTHRISQFLSAFRITLPELASYFDEEGIGGWGDDWVGGWVGWFCAKELVGRINDEVKARLWDVYFSYPGLTMDDGEGMVGGPGEELHIYVCIALLKSCADALEVLEQSEIRTLLQQMPPVEDVEGILREARRIKEQVLVAEREEEEGYLARRSSGGSHSGSQGSIMS
jgi:TBC1 domain family member 2